jgi:hypothetical protein
MAIAPPRPGNLKRLVFAPSAARPQAPAEPTAEVGLGQRRCLKVSEIEKHPISLTPAATADYAFG